MRGDGGRRGVVEPGVVEEGSCFVLGRGSVLCERDEVRWAQVLEGGDFGYAGVDGVAGDVITSSDGRGGVRDGSGEGGGEWRVRTQGWSPV
jgi:hypothetical protein